MSNSSEVSDCAFSPIQFVSNKAVTKVSWKEAGELDSCGSYGFDSCMCAGELPALLSLSSSGFGRSLSISALLIWQ